MSAFQGTVEGAFASWTTVDPVSGLGTSLYFVPDLSTPVSSLLSSNVRLGSEIDLFGAVDASFWDPGNTRTQAETFLNWNSAPNLSLTSGTANYGGVAISGPTSRSIAILERSTR